MLSVLDAFGIQDPTILTDKDRLATYLALNKHGNEGDGCCSQALVSAVVTLVNVVYSLESRLEELEHEMPKNGQRAVKDLRLRRSRRAGSSETDSENRYGNFHRARGDEADEDDEKNDEELRTDGSGSGGQERGLENDDDDNEDNEDDEDDAEEENEHTDDSEGDIDDDLNSVFDSTSLSDFTEHPVPINFTYNYKPQQMMNLKMPTNVPAGEKSGRTISVINWTDVPLSQIAMKYNVSKSVIGPTLQVLRDFEKRNTKALQESIKRNRAASQEKKMLKESEEKSRVDEVENGKAKGENGVVKDVVSSKAVRSRRRELNAHKIRLRLRSKRGRGGRRSDVHYDESSSESVYDPNYLSDEEEKENNRIGEAVGEGRTETGELPLGKAKDVSSKRPAEDGSGPVLNGNGNGGLKRVKFGENKEHSKDRSYQGSGPVPQTATTAAVQQVDNCRHTPVPGANPTLSNSLYSLLQSASTSQPTDELLGSANHDAGVDKDTTTVTNESDPVFAYALTVNGQYQCKSRGCDVQPFGQYIHLYKHKATQHPQELPS